MRPSKGGAPVPVIGQWVVLHRVGSDRAAPLDSVRSGPGGRFRIRYAPFGAEDALYFVSSRYGGIAYFSPPLRADTVRGGDSDVMVYETTTDTTGLHVQGRHFVLSTPRGSPPRRAVAEVFELENDGTATIVSPDSTTPLWMTHLPPQAEGIAVAPGDVGEGAVAFRPGRAELFAPISPGVRQLVLTYSLPLDAFPLVQPLERPVSVLEILLAEPRASVEGARLSEMAPATIQGQTFRRFLAQDVPASAVMRVTAPPPFENNRRIMRLLASAIGFAMAAAFAIWIFVRYRRPQTFAPVAPASKVGALVAELAAMDARFERQPADGDARAAYERERAQLKDGIARALAEEQRPA